MVTAMARDPLVMLTLLILVLGAVTTPYFLTALNIENLLRNAALFGLLSTGLTLVLLTGRIDLSVAAVMVFSIVTGAMLTVWIGEVIGQRWMVKGNTFVGSPVLFVAISLITGIVLGTLNGIGVAYLKGASFIITLVSMTALRGISYLMTNGAPIYLKGPMYNWLSDAVLLGIPVSFLIFLATLLILDQFLRGTVAGSRFHAIGGNETATIYSGIATQRYVTLAFALSGLCAALAGLVFTARLKSVESALAQGYELTAITVAVIGGVLLSGGVGSLWRVLLASVTFAAGLNLLAIWGIATWYQNLAIGVALILAVGLARKNRG